VPPPDIPAVVAGYLDRHHIVSPRVVPLTGDASDRRYFRVLPASAKGFGALGLTADASPSTRESFVLSVYSAPFDLATLPFVNVATLFASMPVPVPRILGSAPDLGVIALDDLGDLTLQAHVGAAPQTSRAQLYRQAVAFI
jgi:N-acetylmuramate 1-kinase